MQRKKNNHFVIAKHSKPFLFPITIDAVKSDREGCGLSECVVEAKRTWKKRSSRANQGWYKFIAASSESRTEASALICQLT